MSKSNAKKSFGVMLGIAIFLTIIFYIGAITLQSYTLIRFRIPILITLFIAAVSGLTLWRIWKKLTGSDKFVWNYIFHTVFITGFLLCAFYTLNFVCADPSTGHTVKGIVEKKYSKTRHKTRRISRNRYARGEAYKEYYFLIKLPDGVKKEQSVKINRYNRISTGDTLDIPISRGLFGPEVIKGFKR